MAAWIQTWIRMAFLAQFGMRNVRRMIESAIELWDGCGLDEDVCSGIAVSRVALLVIC